MPTKLENQLSQIEAPSAPPDLKTRCLNTIPGANPAAVHSGKTARPFRMQRVALAGALLFSTAVAAAFWNTRPTNNKAAMTSGSVAFAQTMEEFQKVSFGHVKGRDMEAGILKKGWHASDFFRTEIWFDERQGLSRTRLASASNTQPAIARDTSQRALFLPDGISYYCYAASNRVLVTLSRKHWSSSKKEFTNLLAGRCGDLSQTPSSAQWKGKSARLFRGGSQASSDAQKALPGVRRFRTALYVNPDTNLPLAFQEFIIYNDGVPRLLAEYEFDFSRPAASHFDPAPLKKGAIVEHGREID